MSGKRLRDCNPQLGDKPSAGGWRIVLAIVIFMLFVLPALMVMGDRLVTTGDCSEPTVQPC